MTEEMSLAVFDPIRANLAELEKKDSSLVFDHTTPEGEKDLRSWVKRLRGLKGDIARAHKDVKAEALAFGRKVDAVKNELTAGTDKIITERMKPLDEIEAKKRAEAEAIVEAERVAAEKAEQERLADLERREAEASKREAEIKEKERIAKEQQIAADAAEKARKEAERIASNRAKVAEQEKAEAIARAEREKQEAIEAEKEKIRQAERERIAKEEAEQAEQKRLADIEAKRVANKKHREAVEGEIIKALFPFIGTNSVLGSNIVSAIKTGEIPNVTINY